MPASFHQCSCLLVSLSFSPLEILESSDKIKFIRAKGKFFFSLSNFEGEEVPEQKSKYRSTNDYLQEYLYTVREYVVHMYSTCMYIFIGVNFPINYKYSLE